MIQNGLAPFFGLFCRLKYGVRVEKFKEQGNRPFLIMMNHQTVADQFFVAVAFKRPVYFIATEDIFSNGLISKLLRWAVAPIPIKKQSTDLRAVRACLKVAKEGGTIALAPEGNRTYDGRTVYINPAIAALARKLRMPIAFFRIEGGYGVDPRWGGKTRKGKIRAYVSAVIEPEELSGMSSEDLYERIQKELYVDENAVIGEYRSKNAAEYLERLLYVCPHCGLSEFESHGDTVECKICRRKVRYLPTKELQGVGFDHPFRFIGEWYDHQCAVVNELDLSCYKEIPLYRDRAKVSEVIVYQNKETLAEQADIALFGDRVVIAEKDSVLLELPFEKISVATVLGRNKLNIYFDGHIYQLKGDARFNAVKYMNIYHHFKNINSGEENGKFLGL